MDKTGICTGKDETEAEEIFNLQKSTQEKFEYEKFCLNANGIKFKFLDLMINIIETPIMMLEWKQFNS